MIVLYFITALFAVFFLNPLAFLRYMNGPSLLTKDSVPIGFHRAWFVFTVLAVTVAAVWTWNRQHSLPGATSFSHNNHVFITTYEKADGPVPLAIIKHHWNCQNDSEYIGDGVVSLPPHPKDHND